MQRTPVADIFDPVFIPPHENAWVIWMLMTMSPVIGRFYAGIERLTIPDRDLAQLRALRGSRAILAVNHPSRDDPIVLFWLSRLVGEHFNYLAAREALTGYQGWVMTRAGAYSVLPGVNGSESIRTTSRLLQAQRKIVIFPEGDIDDCDPALLPFHAGVTQLGFWALDELKRAGQTQSLPIVPLALKYEYSPGTQRHVESALSHLEQTIRLPATPALSPQHRLARIHERMVARLETSERLCPKSGDTVTDRVHAIRESILRRISGFLNVSPEGDGPLQRQNLARQLMRWTGLPGDRGAYLQRLHDHRVEVALILNQDLQRLQNLEATAPAASKTELSLDRFVAIVQRCELEMFGHVTLKPRRRAMLRVGDIVKLEEYSAQYRADRNATTHAITAQLEQNVRAQLQPVAPTSLPAAPFAATLTRVPESQAATDRTV